MYGNPKLRESIDIKLHQDGEDNIIILSCQLEISQPLALVAAVGPILMQLDGTKSTEEIEEHFAQHQVPKEIIHRVLELLSTQLYLSDSKFHARKAQMLFDFRDSKLRPAVHAGRIYSDKPEELQNYLRDLLAIEATSTRSLETKSLTVLVAPHIDYRRGSRAYANAYRQFVGQAPDICILMGTSHQAGRSLFQLCSKDFACPNGTLEIHADFLTTLMNRYGTDRSLADELLHRREHSLELQIPFLNHLCPQTKIVPILVGSFYPHLQEKQRPEQDSEYQDFIDALSSSIAQFESQGLKICIIASVDMAHVGKNFGDDFLLSADKINEIENLDKIYLNSINELSSQKMFDHIAADYDQRRVCGFSTMHTVIDVLVRLGKKYEVEQFDYQQAVDQDTQCLVSFAAMGIFETDESAPK